MKKSALIFRHLSPIHLGSYADVLRKNDIEINYFDVYKDDITKLEPLEHDIVIILGGVFSVCDRDEYPFLNDEIKFLKKRIAEDKATLGVCLGAQIIAAALGAKVYKGDQGTEFGWFPLTLSEAGKNSPLRHFDPTLTKMFHSHGDTFELPQGATLLASSEQYVNQGYSYGKNILATQCHPEVEEDLILEWLAMLPGCVKGPYKCSDAYTIRKETSENIETLKNQTSKFLNEWLNSLEF